MDLLMFIMEKAYSQRYSPELAESFRGKCCHFGNVGLRCW